MAQVPARVSQEIVRAARRQRAIRLYNARKERWRFRLRRLRRAFLALSGVWIAALVAGLVLGGLSFMATLLSLLLGIAVFLVLAIYPATPRLHAEDLDSASLPELAGSAELWLEGKRRALPAAALDAIDMIGVRLEQIAPQLAALEESGPAAREVRKLLSEHLPALVDSYTRIPPSLRAQPGPAGATPSEQLIDGLGVISDQIETLSHDLSRNDLDALATRGRFLETKYVDRD
ncbi:hypothetical protein SAMN05518801_102256 [Novosphingobium sp. CF614]|uniref:hypothetical protein n=1 Tax=Novosphingobium sp. CF614 TaxID=1884364 RepID=UPI0008F36C6A|nr:hypothetical protein [Novosphingobium sp. CF614]SFF85963.1 hypothetical protein SAMN05518801_102256 [Novosphingobium sp. CF614]